ncbi:MAG: DUF4301 family protein [Flavobacteriales bacterium]
MQWKAHDVQAFEQRGWTVDEANRQVEALQTGPALDRALRPALVGDGIERWSADERKAYTGAFRSGSRWARFIPASGAATRMFSAFAGPDRAAAEATWAQFAQRTGLVAGKDPSWRAAVDRWAHVPKGFLPFLHAEDRWFSAFESHVAEWRLGQPAGELHFTVPEAWREAAEKTGLPACWHVQSPSTDTLSWDLEAHAPARIADGSLLFRPGGHGALVEVCERLTADVICVRNVDNVVGVRQMQDRVATSEALAGMALTLRAERDARAGLLDAGGDGEAAARWLTPFHAGLLTTREQVRAALDRPIRVAAMVPAEGHAGGGPFWVRSAEGVARLGILESSELPDGITSGTHFNPVEMALVPHRSSGRIRWADFVEDGAFFTSTKLHDGRAVRILEHPGLWNGSMEGWLTRFVEMPSSLFRPVKTWEDLIP